MKLAEMNWNPSDRQIRQFAMVSLLALPVVGWLWGARLQGMMWLAGIGLAVAITGWIAPRIVKPLFVALSLVALPLGMVMGELAMLAVFFGVFLPIGLIFRMLKRDALNRQIDRSATTYWEPKSQPPSSKSYYRQF